MTLTQQAEVVDVSPLPLLPVLGIDLADEGEAGTAARWQLGWCRAGAAQGSLSFLLFKLKEKKMLVVENSYKTNIKHMQKKAIDVTYNPTT